MEYLITILGFAAIRWILSGITKSITGNRQDNKEETVKYLLSKGVDLEVEDEEGRTPLMVAREYNRRHLIITLLKAGAVNR